MTQATIPLEATLTEAERAILRKADAGFRADLAATARYTPTFEGERIRLAIERQTRNFWAEWRTRTGGEIT